MTSEKDNVLEFNKYIKSVKMPYIIYIDIESLIKKIDGCPNNLGNSSTTKIGEHIPCGYSMSTIRAFDNIENKHILYCGEDCMRKVCGFLRQHAKNVIVFEKTKILLLTKVELKSYQDAKVCYICGKIIIKKLSKNIIYRKVRDHCYYTGTAHGICNFKFNVTSEIPVVFHHGSNYYYHFIIKKLYNEFEGQFECLGENTEKYKILFVPTEKGVTNIDKDCNESVSARFMTTSLSNLVDDLTEGVHKITCKDCFCFLEYEGVQDNLIKYKLLSCNKDYSKKIDEELKKRFKTTFKFSNNDINKFIVKKRRLSL